MLLQSGALCFDRLQQEAEVLLGLRKVELVDVVSQALTPRSRKKLSVHVVAKGARQRPGSEDSQLIIIEESEFECFKNSLEQRLFDPALTAH